MTKVPVQLKSYVGRVFELKKYATIFGSNKPRASWLEEKQKYSHKDFGEVVLILDEGTTKVKVLKKDGFPVWIGKFFLKEEVVPTELNNSTEHQYLQILSTVKTLLAKVEEKLTDKEQKMVNDTVAQVQKMVEKCRLPSSSSS